MATQAKGFDVGKFLDEWNEKAAQDAAPEGESNCRLCGSHVFPHEHGDDQISQRRQQLEAGILP